MGHKPILVTMGDACGIGPEIVVRAAALGELDDAVVVGATSVIERAVLSVGLNLPVRRIDALSEGRQFSKGVSVLEPAALPANLDQLPWGQLSREAGAAAARCIEFAVELTLAGEAGAIVTAPIHKEALALAGVPFPGHTEMLQALANPRNPPAVRMMLANPELRVVLATIHLSLRDAIDALDHDRVLSTIEIAHRSARQWGQARPRIAVAGLNPHAGEGGLFGDEEVRFIAPAVRAAQAQGMDVSGPFAPDTVFMRARRGDFDIVVAMTHDHGLIPVKYLGVEQGVNVTLGLPFVRTSPDHGTAFDIAGRGLADPASLIAALTMARQLTSR